MRMTLRFFWDFRDFCIDTPTHAIRMHLLLGFSRSTFQRTSMAPCAVFGAFSGGHLARHENPRR
jgi:hypothetical protein